MHNGKDSWMWEYPENSYTTGLGNYKQSGVSMSTFKNRENKHDVYRGKNYMKRSCQSLSERAMKIITFYIEEKKLFTKEKQESYENAKIYFICQEKIEINM